MKIRYENQPDPVLWPSRKGYENVLMHVFDHVFGTFIETLMGGAYEPSLRVPSKVIMSGLAFCALIFGASYTAALTTVLEEQREKRLNAVITSYEDAARNEVHHTGLLDSYIQLLQCK